MNLKQIQKGQKEGIKTERINLRITKKQKDLIKKHNISPSKLFNCALKEVLR